MAKKASDKPKAAPKAAAAAATNKARTKNQILTGLAESTGLKRGEVEKVLNDLMELIKKDLGKKGPGSFTIPGLLKLRRAEKPATKARKGINPRTGEEITIPAKPKQTVVRARVLKTLREEVK